MRTSAALSLLLLVAACKARPDTSETEDSDADSDSETDSDHDDGNEVTDPGEVCDGADLNGYTCETAFAGFAGGTLQCSADRLSYDVSGCTVGGTVAAASCELPAVQAAVDSTIDGDTVLVPAGTCTWTGTLEIGEYSYSTRLSTSRNLVLKGAGVGQTTIILETIDEPSVPNPGVLLRLQPRRPVRVTGFSFDGRGTLPSQGVIDVAGDVAPGANFRIDHNAFLGLTTTGIVAGNLYGVIDHNTFVKDPTAGPVTHVSIRGDLFERTLVAEDSWTRPQDLGTANDVYMEDNTFDHPGIANGPFDAYEGARYVFRHNTVYGANLGHHGFDSALRGIVNFEIYENQIINESPTHEAYVHGVVMEFRSGSGVVFGNVVQRAATTTATHGFYDAFALLRNYRSDEAWTGSNGICNGTSVNDGNTEGGFGYPCKDQIGRSTNQILSPVYAWDNDFQGTVGGNLRVTEHGTGSLATTYHILENRDFYNGVPRPDYVPYPYPHPMTGTP